MQAKHHVRAFRQLLAAALVLACAPLAAQMNAKTVEVVNAPGDALDVRVTEPVTVGGAVAVEGPVTVEPAPGASHLGLTAGDLVRYRVTSLPGPRPGDMASFSRITRTGGGAAPELGVNECLVLLDLRIAFTALRSDGAGGFEPNPGGRARFDVGLADASQKTYVAYTEALGVAGPAGNGVIEHHYDGGWLMSPWTSNVATYERLALVLGRDPLDGDQTAQMTGADATGYLVECP